MSDGKNSNSLSLPLIRSLSQNPKSNSLDVENVENPKLLQSAAEVPQGTTLNQHVSPEKKNKIRYLSKVSLAGLVSSGITHTLVTPLDIVKTQLQVYPNLYKNLAIAFKEISTEVGSEGIYRGWKPICLGYSLHGFFQLGLYEYYKDKYSKWYSPKRRVNDTTPVSRSKFKVVALAAATSEILATLILCPFEAIKVKFQTNNSLKHYNEAKHNILAYEGAASGFYKGVHLMWLRQIPYSVIKLTAYDGLTDYIYRQWLGVSQHNCDSFVQSIISFSVGFLSGVFGAVVTHPADIFVARLYHSKYPVTAKRLVLGGNNGQILSLLARMLMLGTVNGLQFWIYNNFKIARNKNVVLV